MASKKQNVEKGWIYTPGLPINTASKEPRSGVGRGIGLQFAEAYFPQAKQILRIASGYFYLSGYEATRSFIPNTTKIHFLVGKESQKEKAWAGRERVTATIGQEISSVIEGFYQELGQTPTELYEAVRDLSLRIIQQNFIISEARQVKHSHLFHCKFYISDNHTMWSGSVNYSKPGLMTNEEQAAVSKDADEIAMFTQYYDNHLHNSRDLLAEVRACLEAWLDMLSPFDAYLKILHCLYHEEQKQLGDGGLYPTYYQEGIILRALDQIKKHKGCLLLIATGLGKTVIGAEIAWRTTAPHFQKRVLILAPRVVEEHWKQQFKARQITPDFFDIGMLFRPESTNRKHEISVLLHLLQKCDDTTVVLIDEAHYYRKVLHKDYSILRQSLRPQRTQRKPKSTVNRVKERVEKLRDKEARIVLLTATPYGTNRQNVNSLLSLLPHEHAPPRGLLQEADLWEVSDIKNTAHLDIVTVFGLFHLLKLARDRGDVEENNRLFIDMGNGKKSYLPKSIVVTPIFYRMFLEKEISATFDSDIFSSSPVPMDTFNDASNRPESIAADMGRNLAMSSWLSSPVQMAHYIRECLRASGKAVPVSESDAQTLFSQTDFSEATDGQAEERGATEAGYNIPFIKSKKEREKALRPLLVQIDALRESDDDKLSQLFSVLTKEGHRKSKTIVFVEHLATAIYTTKGLLKRNPFLKIGCTVQEGAGKNGARHSLKTLNERRSTVQSFAPIANNAGDISPEETHDILICTDADGIGIDMQDACVVVNYDLPSSADELFQRAGRILRMTSDRERIIYLYTLTPSFDEPTSRASDIVQKARTRTQMRHDQSSSLFGSRILSDTHKEVLMATPDDIDVFAQIFRSPVEDETSPPDAFAVHISTMKKHLERASVLPPVSLSAKQYIGDAPRLILLFFFENIHHLVLYNAATEAVENVDQAAILDYLLCKTGEEKAPADFVSAKLVEQEAIKAANAAVALMGKTATQENPCTRVCAVYLNPEPSPKQNMRKMLRPE